MKLTKAQAVMLLKASGKPVQPRAGQWSTCRWLMANGLLKFIPGGHSPSCYEITTLGRGALRTHGRLEVRNGITGGKYAIYTEAGVLVGFVAHTRGGCPVPRGEFEANAARLVHCWNYHDKMLAALKAVRLVGTYSTKTSQDVLATIREVESAAFLNL